VRRVRTHLRGEAFDEHSLDTCLFSLIRLFIVPLTRNASSESVPIVRFDREGSRLM